MKHLHILFFMILFAVVTSAQSTFNPVHQKGRQLYRMNCASCHGLDGRGLPGITPPLAKSDFLATKYDSCIIIIVKGLKGPTNVNGIQYSGSMPGTPLSPNEVADLLNYIGNMWGNHTSKMFDATYINDVLKKF